MGDSTADFLLEVSSVTKLTSGNFFVWNKRFLNLLQSKELDHLILDTVDVSLPTYKRDNAKVIRFIYSTVDSANTAIVDRFENAHEVYCALKAHHGQNKYITTYNLILQLLSLKLAPGGNIPVHLTRMREIENALRVQTSGQTDLLVPDPLIAIVLLTSLGNTYENLVQSILMTSDSLSTADVYSRLQLEHERQMVGSGGSPSVSVASFKPKKEEGLAAAEKGKKPVGQGPRPSSLQARDRCTMCKRFGICHRHKIEGLERQVKQGASGGSNLAASDEVASGMSAMEGNVEVAWIAGDVEALVGVAEDAFVLDSGCSRHMFKDSSVFGSLSKISPVSVSMGSTYGTLQASQGGDARVTLSTGQRVVFRDALYSPQFTRNLLSVGKIVDAGFKIQFTPQLATIFSPSNAILGTASRLNGRLWHLNLCKSSSQSAQIASLADVNLWHRRMGHLHEQGVRILLKELREPVNPAIKFEFCDACQMGKSTIRPYSSKTVGSRSTIPLGRIHSDLMGPSHVQSLSGKRYICTFLDDHTHRAATYFLANKSDAFAAFKEFKTLVETQIGKKILCLRTDRGGEYHSNEFNEFMAVC